MICQLSKEKVARWPHEIQVLVVGLLLMLDDKCNTEIVKPNNKNLVYI